jgi:hypothetical protein
VVLKKKMVLSGAVDPYDFIPKDKWQEYCNIINAERAKEDIEIIIKELHLSAGLGEYPFTDGASIGGISIKKAQQKESVR